MQGSRYKLDCCEVCMLRINRNKHYNHCLEKNSQGPLISSYFELRKSWETISFHSLRNHRQSGTSLKTACRNWPIAFIPRSTMSRDTIERGTNAIGQLKTLEQTNKQCSEELNVLEDAKKLTSFISGFLLDHNLLVPRLVKWILILETSPTLTLIQFFKLWTRMDQFNSRFKYS